MQMSFMPASDSVFAGDTVVLAISPSDFFPRCYSRKEMSSPPEYISKGPLPHPPVDNLDHGPVEGIISKPVDVGPLPGESQDVDPDKQAAQAENSQQEHDIAGDGAVEDKEVAAEPVDENKVVAEPVEEKVVVAEPLEEKDVVAEPVVIDQPEDETHVVADPAVLPKSEDVGLTTDGPAVFIDDKPTGQTVEVVDSAATA
jgi:hypothetical protein